MKTVKAILTTTEIACIIAVVSLSFSENAAHNMGHMLHASYISVFTVLAVVLQRERQNFEEEDE